MAYRGYKNSKKKSSKYDKKFKPSDQDDKGGAGIGSDKDGDRGDYHNGGQALTKLMLNCQKAVASTLKWGKFSDSSVEKAISIVEKYVYSIEAKIASWVKPDIQPVSVTVEAAAAATGDAAQANAHVKLGVFDIDGSSYAKHGAKLVIGTAESYAAANGDDSKTYVNTFSSVKGVDTGEIVSYYAKGGNFEKAVECLVAIDWEGVFDKNLVFTKHHSFYGRMKKEIGDGHKISASTDVHVEADNYAQVHSGVKALAMDDTVKAVAEADAIAS